MNAENMNSQRMAIHSHERHPRTTAEIHRASSSNGLASKVKHFSQAVLLQGKQSLSAIRLRMRRAHAE